MSLNLAPGPLINAVSGFLLIVLATLVVSVKPRRGRNLFLATFCAGLGLWTVVFYLLSRDDAVMPFAAPVAGVSLVASAAGLVGLAVRIPQPLGWSRLRLLIVPAAVSLAGLALMVWGTIVGLDAWMRATGVPDDKAPHEFVLVVAYCFFAAAVAFSLVLFPLRWRSAADAHERSQIHAMAAGIVVYMGLVAGIFFLTPLILTLTMAVAIAVPVGASAALWLMNSAREGGGRVARNLALFSLVTVLVGMLVGAWLGGFTGARGAGLYGVGRTAAIGVFAYAILKHQLLGIDVKLRFAISKSTVAAVFIAVFFIASEVAQQFFGQQFRSQYAGIGAAGLLVLGIAPLQRFADKLAGKAVPDAAGAEGGPTASSTRASDAYRHGLRAAMRDGRLTRREERHLAELARTLGIDGVEALNLREQIEKEAR